MSPANLMLRLAVTADLEDLRPLFPERDAIYRKDDWSAGQASGFRYEGTAPSS
jgi:hypothetical protein